MHIGFVTIPLGVGGAERLILEEASYFAEHAEEVTLVVPEFDGEFVDQFDLPGNVTILTYGASTSDSGSLNFFTETWAIHSALSGLDLDLVFCHYKTPQLWAIDNLTDLDLTYTSHVHGSILWFVNNVRLLPHLDNPGLSKLIESVPGHSEFQGDIEATPIERAKAEVSEFIKERSLVESEVVFTGSNRVAEELRTLYGVDPEVVHPGVSAGWIRSRDSTPTARLMDRENVVLCVSRLDERKRFDVLVRAFAELRERRSDVGVVIGGVGPEREALEREAERLGVADDVAFAGFIPDEDLPSYYKSAEVFACPAWMSYGLVPLEAYSMDTKVALSTDTYVKELLAGSEGVAVSEPTVSAWADCLDRMIDLETNGTDVEAVPTWEEYCTHKHRILRQRGLL